MISPQLHVRWRIVDTGGFDEELIQKAIEVWQDKYACTISKEAAVQTLKVLAVMAEVLFSWEIPDDSSRLKGDPNA